MAAINSKSVFMFWMLLQSYHWHIVRVTVLYNCVQTCDTSRDADNVTMPI